MLIGVGANGPDVADFISAHLDPVNAGSVLHNHLGELTDDMRKRLVCAMPAIRSS
ncbi:MAG: hypothetical protein ACI9P3_006292 [Bradyrhizobium sp.]|nr:hypothetical protein [Burkholderia sp.]